MRSQVANVKRKKGRDEEERKKEFGKRETLPGSHLRWRVLNSLSLDEGDEMT